MKIMWFKITITSELIDFYVLGKLHIGAGMVSCYFISNVSIGRGLDFFSADLFLQPLVYHEKEKINLL